MNFFDFSVALNLLKQGKVVTRKGWNNPNIKVLAQYPDENSKMSKPYLYMEKGYDDTSMLQRFPLDLSCESIFAEDWFEVI